MRIKIPHRRDGQLCAPTVQQLEELGVLIPNS